MRPDIIDPETGERVPFSDFKDFRKLLYLARTTGDGSDFQCTTRAGVITDWSDSRPQPTYDEIEAVLDEDVDRQQEEEEEDTVSFADHTKKLAMLAFNHENRLRALEGKQPVTWRTFIRSVKNSG